jgi:WD40 repeat protein
MSRLLGGAALACLAALLGAVAAPPPAVKGRAQISAANVAKVGLLREIARGASSIHWKPDSKQFILAAWKQPVEVFDAATFRPLFRIAEGKTVTRFAAHPDWERVALCEDGSRVEVLNRQTKETVKIDAGNPHPAVAFSPDGKRLVTGGAGLEAKLWCATCGCLLESLSMDDFIVLTTGLTATFSPDGRTVAVGSHNSSSRLFDVKTGRLLHTQARKLPQELRFSPDGKTLAVAYRKGNVALWDVATGKLLRELGTGATDTLDWSPAGDVLVTGGDNGVTLWDAKRLVELKRLDAAEEVDCARFSPDGTLLLISAGPARRRGERKVKVWGVR